MDITSNTQTQFFATLAESLPDQTLVLHLMEILGLQKGAVYKRMNGETTLSATELIQIAEHFGISLDNIFFQQKFISFSHPFMQLEKTKSEDFLALINQYLEVLNEERPSELVYLSNELPFFYSISRRYIFAFLYAVWDHLHWEEGGLKIANVGRVDKNVEVFRREISEYYDCQPVTEIWNPHMFSNLYQQIIFCISINAFENTDFINGLLLDIEQLVNYLKEIAYKGQRKSTNLDEKVDLKIYLNEFGSYQNLIIYKALNQQLTFLGFDYPQFIVTKNKQFYEYADAWIHKIKQRSVLISGEGLQYRERFFNKLEEEFLRFKEQTLKLLDSHY